MNNKEKTVLFFLTIAFVVGAGFVYVRRRNLALRAASSPIVVQYPADTIKVNRGLLDLNRAKRYELEALPGIGPKLAQRIIDYRERHGGFKTVSQLRNVAGIGPKRYATLRELVVIGPVLKTTGRH